MESLAKRDSAAGTAPTVEPVRSFEEHLTSPGESHHYDGGGAVEASGSSIPEEATGGTTQELAQGVDRPAKGEEGRSSGEKDARISDTDGKKKEDRVGGESKGKVKGVTTREPQMNPGEKDDTPGSVEDTESPDELLSRLGSPEGAKAGSGESRSVRRSHRSGSSLSTIQGGLHIPIGGKKTVGGSDSKPVRVTVTDNRTGSTEDRGSSGNLSELGREYGAKQGVIHEALQDKGASAPIVQESGAAMESNDLSGANNLPGRSDENVRILEFGYTRTSGEIREATQGSAAAESLGRFIQERGGAELVRQAGILLKSHNQGEIRLVLKPETLGSVRIHLNLDNNNLTGKILVESGSVRDTFDQNIEALQRGLRESGFETARLEVGVGGEQRRSNSHEERREPQIAGAGVAVIDAIQPGVVSGFEESTKIDLIA